MSYLAILRKTWKLTHADEVLYFYLDVYTILNRNLRVPEMWRQSTA